MSKDTLNTAKSKWQYDISVIVPVYNGEKYLPACLDSLVSQSLYKKNFEVLLIDDGSKDKSAEICKKYADKYSIFKYHYKENSGVSDTRNLGIKSAKGRYITFLDCDDYISKNTLADLVEFFDKHEDEVDIITYSMVYENENGKHSTNKRYKLMPESAVYDIDENIHIDQTTMNICVKNLDEPELFDTRFTMAEDQFYISGWIAKRRNIGFVKEATYFYRRHSGAATAVGNNPYYCFDQMIEFFDSLCKNFALEDGSVDRIAQALILYNLGWRIRGDVIFPYHYEKEEFDKAVEKVIKYVKVIDNDLICSCPHLNPSHRLYLLRLKGAKANVDENGVFTVEGDTEDTFTTDNCLLVIRKSNIRNNKLTLDGFVKTPASEFFPVELYVKRNDGEKEKVELKNSSFSNYMSKIKTNHYYAFSLEFDMDEVSEINFTAVVDGHEVPTTFFLSKTSPLNFGHGMQLKGHTLLKMKRPAENRDKFIIKHLNFLAYAFYKIWIEYLHFKRNYRGTILRNFLRRVDGNIWLYTDRNDVVDNALYQFEHDILKDDGVLRYYIADNPEEFYKYVPENKREFIIKRNSVMHKRLFLSANKLLFSFSSLSAYSPFGNAAYSFYSDLMDAEQIYLQHGVLHARLPNLYDKERYNFSKVVISTVFEKENMVKNYGYDPEDLIPSGMPRYTTIDLNKKSSNKILLAPSWRSTLIGPLVMNERELRVDAFLKSTFYKEIESLITSPKFISILEKYDLELELKNHPIFEPYNEYFKPASDRIKVVSGQTDLAEYKLMITDYSSFLFDFVYLERPLIYFVPDYDMFKAGLSSPYRQLDLPLEDGLGAFVQDADSLIEEIEKIADNGFKNMPEYAKKMDGFFLSKDNQTEKLYDYLMKN